MRIQVKLICLTSIIKRAQLVLSQRGLKDGGEVAPERVRLLLGQSLVATVARRLAAGPLLRNVRELSKWLITDVSAVEANT